MSHDTVAPFLFPAISRKKVTAAFDGGRITSDGGVMLLAAAERRVGMADRLARLIADPRNPLFVTHSVADILRARMLAIACGYEDADDLDHLRTDPGFKLACGRLPDSGRDLCSQPTVSRWENAPNLREVVRLSYAMVDAYCTSYDRPPRAVTLDIDDTVDIVQFPHAVCPRVVCLLALAQMAARCPPNAFDRTQTATWTVLIKEDLPMAQTGTMYPGIAEATRPEIRKIAMADLREALRQGMQDFLAIPTQLVFLCILYPIIGMVAARAAIGTDLLPLLFPLVAGIALLGPVLAVGIYELSRRRELGLPVSWLNAFDVLRSPAIFSIALVGCMLLAVFVVWIGVARAIYGLTLGWAPPTSLEGFVRMLQTPAGLSLAVIGNVVGAVFSFGVLMLTVVSVPMMLDRHVSPVIAVQTSIRAVIANPTVMLVWGIVLAAALVLGCLPLFIGLAVAIPVLGHATWHLYRRVVV